MTTFRLRLFLILTVAACLLTSRPLAAGPYHVPGITSAYTLVPQSGICEQRIQRIERTLEQIAKKVGVEVEPPIVTLHSTRLITRADGVTVLDESCLPDSSTTVLDIISGVQCSRPTLPQRSWKRSNSRIELLGQMLKAFDELRRRKARSSGSKSEGRIWSDRPASNWPSTVGCQPSACKSVGRRVVSALSLKSDVRKVPSNGPRCRCQVFCTKLNWLE